LQLCALPGCGTQADAGHVRIELRAVRMFVLGKHGRIGAYVIVDAD
jgi:hypothetical protein